MGKKPTKKPTRQELSDSLGHIVRIFERDYGKLDKSQGLFGVSLEIAKKISELGAFEKSINKEYKSVTGSDINPFKENILTIISYSKNILREETIKRNMDEKLAGFEDFRTLAFNDYAKNGSNTELLEIPERLESIRTIIHKHEGVLFGQTKDELYDLLTQEAHITYNMILNEVGKHNIGITESDNDKYIQKMSTLNTLVKGMNENLETKFSTEPIERNVIAYIDTRATIPMGLLKLAETHPKLYKQDMDTIWNANIEYDKLLTQVANAGFNITGKIMDFKNKNKNINDKYYAQKN